MENYFKLGLHHIMLTQLKKRPDLDAEYKGAVHYTAGFKMSDYHRGKVLGVASAIEETRESGDSSSLIKVLTTSGPLKITFMHLGFTRPAISMPALNVRAAPFEFVDSGDARGSPELIGAVQIGMRSGMKKYDQLQATLAKALLVAPSDFRLHKLLPIRHALSSDQILPTFEQYEATFRIIAPDRAAALRISARIMSTRESSKENTQFLDLVNKKVKAIHMGEGGKREDLMQLVRLHFTSLGVKMGKSKMRLHMLVAAERGGLGAPKTKAPFVTTKVLYCYHTIPSTPSCSTHCAQGCSAHASLCRLSLRGTISLLAMFFIVAVRGDSP
jgi:hypothetical protein